MNNLCRLVLALVSLVLAASLVACSSSGNSEKANETSAGAKSQEETIDGTFLTKKQEEPIRVLVGKLMEDRYGSYYKVSILKEIVVRGKIDAYADETGVGHVAYVTGYVVANVFKVLNTNEKRIAKIYFVANIAKNDDGSWRITSMEQKFSNIMEAFFVDEINPYEDKVKAMQIENLKSLEKNERRLGKGPVI